MPQVWTIRVRMSIITRRVHLGLLSGEVDPLAELHEAALGLGQEVELCLVEGEVPGEALDLVAQDGDLLVLVGHREVPLETGLGLAVL